MGRPKKDGMDYFSVDVDFFSDKKIKILKARYGADGITIYLYLLCEIYKNGYYLEMDEDYEFILSDDLNMECSKVKQVLNFLLERSLLDSKLFQSDKVLTSAGIQKRYQLMVKSRASKNPIMIDRYWLLKEAETETFIKVRHLGGYSKNNPIYSNSNSENNCPGSENKYTKESKVKESKEKEKKLLCKFEDKELEETFWLFVTAREESEKGKLSHEVVQGLREELTMIAETDAERIAIAKKAFISGWKSFYPLKKASSKTKKNAFSNFDSRSYNMDALESQLLSGE